MNIYKPAIMITIASFIAPSLLASGITYKDGDKEVKIGGRIQVQYHSADDDGDTTDELLFRRIRPFIQSSLHKDWRGQFQFDMGKKQIELKDTYLAYLGLKDHEILAGNYNFPFSREFITSSRKQQLIERTFVGDHNYGSPDRQAGLHMRGKLKDGLISWHAAVGKAMHDPDEKKLDFETVVSLNKEDDWSEGNIIGGRIDVHPFGHLEKEQGDFNREMKATVGVAGFSWNNDNDNLNPYAVEGDNTHTSKLDLDTASGFEVSAAIRIAGISIDAQYNIFNAELKDEGITIGLYEDSETTLVNYAIESGYMIIADKVEVIAGYQNQDADNYEKPWNRTSVGLNYFFKKHDIKCQITYRMGENKDGEDGHDIDEFFLQAQYVF